MLSPPLAWRRMATTSANTRHPGRRRTRPFATGGQCIGLFFVEATVSVGPVALHGFCAGGSRLFCSPLVPGGTEVGVAAHRQRGCANAISDKRLYPVVRVVLDGRRLPGEPLAPAGSTCHSESYTSVVPPSVARPLGAPFPSRWPVCTDVAVPPRQAGLVALACEPASSEGVGVQCRSASQPGPFEWQSDRLSRGCGLLDAAQTRWRHGS
jgi:hypothetical protein